MMHTGAIDLVPCREIVGAIQHHVRTGHGGFQRIALQALGDGVDDDFWIEGMQGAAP